MQSNTAFLVHTILWLSYNWTLKHNRRKVVLSIEVKHSERRFLQSPSLGQSPLETTAQYYGRRHEAEIQRKQHINACKSVWRDLNAEGHPGLPEGGTILPNFPENWMKMKKLHRRGLQFYYVEVHNIVTEMGSLILCIKTGIHVLQFYYLRASVIYDVSPMKE